VYVFVLLCLAGFLNSCEREVLKGDEKIVQVEPATWQEQIKYAQNRNRIGTETYNSDRPCLLNYTYKGTIESNVRNYWKNFLPIPLWWFGIRTFGILKFFL